VRHFHIVELEERQLVVVLVVIVLVDLELENMDNGMSACKASLACKVGR
jgi:hypothetical protein